MNQQPESCGERVDEFVSIGLQLAIGGENVQFEVRVPAGKASREHLLPFMRSLIKVGSDIAEEHFAGHGHKVSCQAGCGICCRQRVPLAEFEAHRLRRHIEAMPEPRRSDILERFRSAEQKIQEAGRDVAFDSTASLEEMTRSAGRYFRLMIPCPFLENESCSIYEERPLKCREHLVLSPAEHCAVPEENRVETLPLPLKVFMTALCLSDETSSRQIHWIPLTQLVSWTDRNPEPPSEKTGPELLHEFMTQLMQPAAGRSLDHR